MNSKMNIPAPKSVHLIHNLSSDYSRITLRVTISGMKITAVALDSNLHPTGRAFEHEIEPKSTDVGLDLILPPDTHLIVRELPELIQK